MNRQGNLFVVAAASGSGKTSLVNALLQSVDNLVVSISHTTRSPRPHDMEGKDYFFVSESTFKEMIEQQAFLEHAEIYGRFYGTSRQWVMQQLSNGVDVILEIDWQGYEQVRRLFPETIAIFILPPSKNALLERLKNRGQDTQEEVLKRFHAAKEGIAEVIKAQKKALGVL